MTRFCQLSIRQILLILSKTLILNMKKLKTIPKFSNEDEEREFWATQSPLDYFLAEDFKEALNYAVKQVNVGQLEKKHKKGYGQPPAGKTEFSVWESEQEWGDL